MIRNILIYFKYVPLMLGLTLFYNAFIGMDNEYNKYLFLPISIILIVFGIVSTYVSFKERFK